MSDKTKLLIVDDEENIRRMLRMSLPEQEFSFVEADSGAEALRSVATHNPELLILDLGLPDMDGLEVITELRKWSDIPVIVLSARGEEKAKVDALDAGAYDYVTKPFSVPELTARIRVALRLFRSRGAPEPTDFETEGLRISFAKRQVFIRDAEVHLTPHEYKLLCLLARNCGRVLTHQQILSHVWGAAYAGQNHYVRILMKGLRNKIEEDRARPKLLLTESGVGYRLKGV